MSIFAIDTETTGLDVYHGARPFFLTCCQPNGRIRFWEWDVDPYTRNVLTPKEDLAEIQQLLTTTEWERIPGQYLNLAKKVGLTHDVPVGVFIDRLKELEHESACEVELALRPEFVLQNSKFDVAMLRALMQDWYGKGLTSFEWDWSRTHDTLIMGHMLASNKPHDLTSMAVQYLGVDIEPLEKSLEVAVKKCRLYCQHNLREWRIARAGQEEMPSAGDKTWKYDAWLPRALADHLDHPVPKHGCKHKWGTTLADAFDGNATCSKCNGHRWYTVLQEYANADSGVTIALYGVMVEEIKRRGLWEIYLVRRKAMELAHRMEWRGVTESCARTDAIDRKYAEESAIASERCVAIAAELNYELTLPKSGMNHSLKHFCFGKETWEEDEHGREILAGKEEWLKLPVLRRTDGGQPSMDKNAMEEYLILLTKGSPQLDFVRHLIVKRQRDTARNYIAGYRRFWLPWHKDMPDTFVLHPNLNPCGTDTLRWSSNHPNEQNISKKGVMCIYCFGDGEGDGPDGKCTNCKGKGTDPENLRFCFGPEEGYEWYSFDAKNIELRLPFYKAGEQELIDLFERPDDAPYYGSNHLLNFHTIYPEIWEKELAEVGFDKVGPHCKKKYAATWYTYCKNMGFAKQYGAQRAKVDATAKKVGAYDKIEVRFKKLGKLNAECIRFANEHGYIETWPDKTVNPTKGYPLLCTRTDNGSILPTVPLSYKTQSTAMWWTFKAMIRVQDQLDRWLLRDRFDAYIALQVHDELVVAMPKSRVDPGKWIPRGEGSNTPENRKIFLESNLWRVWQIKRLMAMGGEDLGVPTPVGVEYHSNNWGEGVTLA